MYPHPLANPFKRSNYEEPISSELSALDYIYEGLLEICESENCDEVLKEEIYEVFHDSSLNEKHDCNGVIINSINDSYANNMHNPMLGDANFDISSTYFNHYKKRHIRHILGRMNFFLACLGHFYDDNYDKTR